LDVTKLTIEDASGLIERGDLSPVELTRAYIDRIESLDGRLNSYITVLAEAALAEARRAEEEIARGRRRGPLHGVPLGIKDIFVMRGAPTTCGSRMLADFLSPYDATVVQRLRAAGAVILGKNNMDEFAMGSSTETSYFGPTRNPWDEERVPGGSSGGSAAAVAACLCTASVGTDTGGSIRQPAALCGVVGMKPTYGRVSRYGMVAFASSLDQAGPIARTVTDAALVLAAIAGHDPMDSTSVSMPVPDYLAELEHGVRGLRVGVPREYFIEGIDDAVRDAVTAAIEVFRGLGAEIVDVSLPHTEYAVPAYYIIAPSEASSNLARYDGVRYGYRAEGAKTMKDVFFASRSEGFGDEVKRRIMLGTYALSAGYYDAYYLKAQRVRTLIRRDFDMAFERADVLVTPTAPETAFRLGEKTGDPLKMYLSDVFTIPCNLAGLPGVSVPCGLSPEGLPVGLQIVGRPFDEATVLRVARAYEAATEWSLLIPPAARGGGSDGGSKGPGGER